MLGFGITVAGSRVRSRNAPVLRSATRDLIARMDPPPGPERTGQIDRLIGTLIDGGIWSRLDTLLLLAAHSARAALLNWTGSRDAGIGGGAPVFVADRGYWCDGFDDWIDTGMVPTTARAFQRNSAMFGGWTRKDGRNPVSPIGAITGSALLINPRNASNGSVGRLNGTASVNGGTVDTGYGFTVIDRNSSTRLRHFVNGKLAGTTNSASSTAPTSATIGMGLTNDLFSEGQFCAFVAGDTLSDAQHLTLAGAITTYLRDIGMAPVPAVVSRTLSPVQAIALPDGSAPIATGSGMAISGITRDAAGRWYLANGRSGRHPLLFTRMSADLSVIEQEFDLTRLALSADYAGSCQCIGCDPTTGRIWFLLKQAGSSGDRSFLGAFDPATNALAGAPVQVQAGDNGLAYDGRRDGFWVVRDQNELVLYDRQGRARSGAIELPANSDHVAVVDGAQGAYAAGDIVVTCGANGVAGSVVRLRTLDYGGPTASGVDILSGADSIEGVHIGDGKLWIANDAATTAGGGARNQILIYSA